MACIVLFLLGNAIQADDVPVAPLHRDVHPVYGDVYLLKNDVVEAWVSPTAGAVVDVRILSSSNLLAGPLRFLPDLDPDRLQKALPRLDGLPYPIWDARGWRNGDGSKVVMLTQQYGPPLSLRVTQLVRLGSTGVSLDWEGRFTASATAEIERVPLVEWNVPGLVAWPSREKPCGAEEPTHGFRALSDHAGQLCLWDAQWRLDLPGTTDAASPPRWQGSAAHPDWRWLAPLHEILPPVGWTQTFHLRLLAQTREPRQTPCEQAEAWSKDWPPFPGP